MSSGDFELNSVHLILPPEADYVPKLPSLSLPSPVPKSGDWAFENSSSHILDHRLHQIHTYLSDYIQNPPSLNEPCGLINQDPYVPGRFLKYESIFGPVDQVHLKPQNKDDYIGLLYDTSTPVLDLVPQGQGQLENYNINNEEDEGRGSASGSSIDDDSLYQEGKQIEIHHQFPPERYSTYAWPVSWDDILAPFPYRTLEFNCENIRNRQILQTQQFISETGSQDYWKLIPSNSSSSTITKIKESYEEPRPIELSEFIKHCLHLICGRESGSFTRNSLRSNEFHWNRKFLVSGISPTTLENFTQPLLLVGSEYKRLVQKVRERIDDGFQAENSRNYVYNFVMKSISGYIEMYESFIMVQVEIVRTLVGLNKLPRALIPQLTLLNEIIVQADTLPALEFIGILFAMFNTIKLPNLKDLVEGIYKEAVKGYLRHISDWAFRGLLGSREFHIGINEAELSDSRYTLHKTRSHWMRLYEEKDETPKFLSQTLLQLILETGKSIALFQSATAKLDTSKQIYKTYNFQLEPFASLTLCSNFKDLLQLDRKNLELSLQFHSCTHSHFQSQIQAELRNLLVTSVYDIPMDFSQVKRVRLDYQLSHPESQEELHRRRNDMYRILKIYRVETPGTRLVGRKHSNSLEQLFPLKNLSLDSESQLSDSQSRNELSSSASGPLNLGRRLSRSNMDVSQLESGTEILDLPTLASNPYIRSHQDSSQVSLSLIHSSHPDPYDPSKKILPQHFPDNLPFAIGRKSTGQKTKKKVPTSMKEVLTLYNPEEEEEQRMDYGESSEVPLDPDAFLSLTKAEPYEKPKFRIFRQPFVTFGIEPKKHTVASSELSGSTDESCLINYFVAESIAIPLGIQYKMINSSILHYLIVEEKLFAHLGRINDYLFLHNGRFGQFLGNLLIQEVKILGLRNLDDLSRRSRSGRLKEILNESFYEGTSHDESTTKTLMEFFEFTYIGPGGSGINELNIQESEQRKISSIYQVLNSVGLKYSLSWPLNLILTRDIVSFAESTFNLLFHLQRVQLLLEGVFSDYKSKRMDLKLEKVIRYRHRFLHWVSALRSYLSGTIIDPAWKQLLRSLSLTNHTNLEEIYHKIIHYINTISQNCLVSPSRSSAQSKGILKIILRALLVIESFCSNLQIILSKPSTKDHDIISDRDFKNLKLKFDVVEGYELSFIKVLIELSAKFPYRNEQVISLIQTLDFNRFFEEKIWGPGGWAPGKPHILLQRLD